MNLPPVVSEPEWQAAQDALVAKEKDATRARDALAAERRRLPRLRVEKDYAFDAPDGKVTLRDLFEGRRQLLLYHFMFGPNHDAGCNGWKPRVPAIIPNGQFGVPTRSASPASPRLRSPIAWPKNPRAQR